MTSEDQPRAGGAGGVVALACWKPAVTAHSQPGIDPSLYSRDGSYCYCSGPVACDCSCWRTLKVQELYSLENSKSTVTVFHKVHEKVQQCTVTVSAGGQLKYSKLQNLEDSKNARDDQKK